MKKIVLFTVATLVSTASFAQDNDRSMQMLQVAHQNIPHLQAVNSNNLQTFNRRQEDALKFQYVGEHTPAHLNVQHSFGGYDK